MRVEFCALVGKPVDPGGAIAEVTSELHVALGELDAVLTDRSGPGEVRLDDNGDLIIPPLAAAPVPEEAAVLRDDLARLLPQVTLASILVELDSRVGLFRHFEHGAGVAVGPSELSRNLVYVLLAEATNMGLTAMAKACGVSYETLAWTAEWYLREDTVQAANTAMINYHHRLPGAARFGPGTLSSSDGQRFPTRGHSLTARHLSRYFARGQGISTYTHVSDQHSTFATRVIAATASESHYVLDDVLGNDTDLPIVEHSTDTHGATLANFALFDLVGLRLSPRIRDLGKITLCRTGPKAAFVSRYPNAGPLLTRRADTDLIARQWDELLRVAASVKHGHATAALVVGKLCSSARQQNELTAAIKEYGAIRRTIFTARYLADDTYRRRTLRQLNKGENLHDLRRSIAYASEGAVRGHDHVSQTEQMWCLTLITNAVVVWTTEYYTRAARQLRAAGRTINDDHLAHIWPTHHANINLYGIQTIDIHDELAKLAPDGYRPLRNQPDPAGH